MKNFFGTLRLPLRIRPVEAFVPPNLLEFNKYISAFGLSLPPITLAEELAQIAAGAEVKGEVEHEAEIRFMFASSPPLWFQMMGPFKKRFVEQVIFKRIDTLRVMTVIRELSLPGYSFMERFISCVVMYYLVNNSLTKYKVDLFQIKNLLKELTRIVETLDEFERELLGALPSDADMARLPEILQKQFEKEKIDGEICFAGEEGLAIYALGRSVQAIKSQKAFSKSKQLSGPASENLSLCLDLLSHPGRFLIISTSRKLENFSAFSYTKIHQFNPDDRGDEFESRPMESISEIARLKPMDYGFLSVVPTYFYHRAVTLDFQVKEPGIIQEIRQVAYILVDKSPSTLVKGRLFKAVGIIFNRLLGIVRADALVIIQFFDEKITNPIQVAHLTDAVNILSLAKMEHFLGSGTDIDNAIMTGCQNINLLPRSAHEIKPHLILVSDGKAPVSVQANELGNIRFHAFITASDNPELQTICNLTGGLYYKDI